MRAAKATAFVLCVLICLDVRAADTRSADFIKVVAPYLKAHCLQCHSGDKPKGGLSLEALKDLTKPAEVETWRSVLDQIKTGQMPPKKEPRPDAQTTQRVAAWIQTELARALASDNGQLPKLGNLVDHDLLFGRPAAEAAAGPTRIWRAEGPGPDRAASRTDGIAFWRCPCFIAA